MKRSFTLIAVLTGALFMNAAKANNHNDSAQQNLKAKMELMEKHIHQLQTEVKTLRETDRAQQAELSAIKQGTPATRTKKLVIDRRGSKQASFQ